MTDNLKEAMLKYVPQLSSDYKEYVTRTFKAMVEKFGVNLKGVYKDKMWSNVLRGIRDSLKQTHPLDVAFDYQNRSVYTIDKVLLEKNALRYGNDVALAWYDKMKLKLGDLSNIAVSDPSAGGYVTITGNHKSHSVIVEQKPIINVSSRGLAYHQFPARIHVDGQFYSEAQYQRLAKGWGMEIVVKADKVPTQYQCGKCKHTGRMSEFKQGRYVYGYSCPKCGYRGVNKLLAPGTKPKIDPNTRPKKFYFNYLIDYPKNAYGPARHNEKRADSAKGMTSLEALNKVIRSHVSFNRSYPEQERSIIHDFDLDRIYDWRGDLVWKRLSGDPLPAEYKID